MQHDEHMRRAIALGRHGALVVKAGGPFGAVVVRDGVVVGEGHNRVLADRDPTAHGEVVAIRAACRALGTHDLSGCTLYTSAECCPMCYAAASWARVDRIYYAARCEDAGRYGDFDDTRFWQDMARPRTERAVPMQELLRDEAVVVWEEFGAAPDKAWY